MDLDGGLASMTILLCYTNEAKLSFQGVVNAIQEHLKAYVFHQVKEKDMAWHRVRREVRACDVVVLFFAPDSVESRFYQAIVSEAVYFNKQIISVCRDLKDLPFYLKQNRTGDKQIIVFNDDVRQFTNQFTGTTQAIYAQAKNRGTHPLKSILGLFKAVPSPNELDHKPDNATVVEDYILQPRMRPFVKKSGIVGITLPVLYFIAQVIAGVFAEDFFRNILDNNSPTLVNTQVVMVTSTFGNTAISTLTAPPTETVFITLAYTETHTPTVTDSATLTPTHTPTFTATHTPTATPTSLSAFQPGERREFDGIMLVYIPERCDATTTDPSTCQAFWIGLHEVINAQYYGNALSLDTILDTARTNITYREAEDFCLGRGERLPTEAEWEFASRGPDARLYPWGGEWDSRYGENTYAGNGMPIVPQPDTPSEPLDRSWIGVWFMSGNVAEWVASDPNRPVYRGGTWFSTPSNRQLTVRDMRSAQDQQPDIGFRCVRDVDSTID